MKDCIFCKIVCGDASAWKVFETDATVAFFDINPVNEYHTLVIPKSHHTNVFDTPRDVFLEVTSTVKRVL